MDSLEIINLIVAIVSSVGTLGATIIYPDNDKFIVKLKVDYIKHNTTVAFPSILFIDGALSEIPYKITSKNNPNVVEGILKVSTPEEEQK